MAENPMIYEIALSMVKGITPEVVRALPEAGITPEDFFRMERNELSQALCGNDTLRYEKMERDEALSMARREAQNMERHHISGYFLLNDDYPVRLAETPDAPIFIYKLGEGNLNGKNVVSVVGTRRPTPYGSEFAGNIVEELAGYFPELTVVSGLAYGIDARAHESALRNNVPTIAVVAHGLDMIYPAANRDLARAIIHAGGAIISEYPFGEKPYRQRFLQRNRIVAGISDAIVVAESDIRGGAMSTANLAFNYNRDVFALPGRISDQYSSGCNMLIRKQKGSLITCAADLIEIAGWKPLGKSVAPQQRNLFSEIDGDARLIYDALRFSQEPLQIDRLHAETRLPLPSLMAMLGELEFDGIIVKHPGNRYAIS